MPQKKIITIVGAGMMGSAMSRPATDNGCRVHLVGTPLDRNIISAVQASGHHPTLRAQLPDGVTAFQFEDLDAALAEGAHVRPRPSQR